VSDHQELIRQIDRQRAELQRILAKKDAGEMPVEHDLEEIAIDLDALSAAASLMSDRLSALALKIRAER
jgi:septal ring factor EnvC (AmiA/AmiB activator)